LPDKQILILRKNVMRKQQKNFIIQKCLIPAAVDNRTIVTQGKLEETVLDDVSLEMENECSRCWTVFFQGRRMGRQCEQLRKYF
jgi:hypothetical protein